MYYAAAELRLLLVDSCQTVIFHTPPPIQHHMRIFSCVQKIVGNRILFIKILRNFLNLKGKFKEI